MKIRITEFDKTLLLIVSVLTIASLAAILVIAGLTTYSVTVTPVLMVIGWFFGAIMVFAWGKYKEAYNDKVYRPNL